MQHFLTRAPYLSALLGTLAAFALSGPARGQQVPVYSTSTIMYFDGVEPQGSLVTDGVALYGSTRPPGVGTGAAPGGLLYRLSIDPSSLGALSTIYQFGRLDIWNGATPGAGLLLATDGNLYGTTLLTSIDVIRGKINPPGTVFRVSRAGLGYTRLFSYDPVTVDSRNYVVNATGAAQQLGLESFRVQGALIEGMEGGVSYLYGTAFQGGPDGTGTVYKIRADGTGFQVLAAFGPAYLTPGSTSSLDFDLNARRQLKNLNGVNPMERLVLGGDGFVYGVTRDGGPNGTGVIFRVPIAGGSIQVLHAFDAIVVGTIPAPAPPEQPLVAACAVNLDDTNLDGGCPMGGMVLSGGVLYGTTSIMGNKGRGTVFSITTDGSVFTVLRAFNVTDGTNPSGNLILTADGMLAGTTLSGGTLPNDDAGQPVAGSAVGTVYKLSLDGATYREQCVFNTTDAGLKGAAPVGGVVQTSDGNFYGTTAGGGYGGVIYKCGDKYEGGVIGIRPFVDDSGGGNLPLWLLVVLSLVLGLRLMRQRLEMNRQTIY